MRTLLKKYVALGVSAAAVMIVTGCDSEQPAQSGDNNAVLTIATSEAQVFRADVWQIWEDITFPRDGIPDRPRRQFEPNGPIVHRCDVLATPTDTLVYPWGFSVEVAVIRAGTTARQIISTTSPQTDRFTAVTVVPPNLPAPTPVADFDDAPDYFREGNRMSLADPAYADRCLQQVVDPNIGPALDNPATIALSKGDTLLVTARKAGINVNPILNGQFPNPLLIGAVSVGGLPVALSGTSQSTEADGDGINFSFTLY